MFIDDRVKYVGVSKLREINADWLRNIGDTLYVLQNGDEPISVLVGYEQFMRLQNEIEQAEQKLAAQQK